MNKIIGLFYIGMCSEKLIKFFNTKEEAQNYIRNDFFGNEPWTELNTEYRNHYIEEKLQLKEIPLVDVLNEFCSELNDLKDRE